MKKRQKISCHLFLLASFLLIIGSCKKDEENPTISDIDGNIYKTIIIGTQVWMAENLKTTQYNNGTPITKVIGDAEWTAQTKAAYSWYNDDAAYKETYGALYNWYAVNTGNLCPTGWHVPTDAEFNTLELYLGVPTDNINDWGWRGTNEGSEMKTKSGWDDNGNGTNASGFSALPGGYRQYTSGGTYGAGVLTYFWSSSESSSSEAWYRRLDGAEDRIYKAATSKKSGKYVRCLQNPI
jgi:uncharacterized protein (TIGR02145 family)